MKNKEIEELLNYIDQFVYVDQSYNDIKLSKIDCKLILSHIEQLEQCYCNRTDCSSRIKDSKKYDSLLQKIKQLQNNIDKAIEIIEPLVEWGECTINGKILKQIYNILKGDSDEK